MHVCASDFFTRSIDVYLEMRITLRYVQCLDREIVENQPVETTRSARSQITILIFN